MAIHKYFRWGLGFKSTGKFCIRVLLCNLIYLSGYAAFKSNKNLRFLWINTFAFHLKVNVPLNTNDLTNITSSNYFERIDSLPPSKKIKAYKLKSLTYSSQRKIIQFKKNAIVPVKNKTHLVTTSNKVVDGFADIQDLFIRFPLQDLKNKIPKDTTADLFLGFIDQYYKLPFIDSFILKGIPDNIKGRLSITNPTKYFPSLERLNLQLPVHQNCCLQLTIDSFQIKFPSFGEAYNIDSQKLILDPNHINFSNLLIQDANYNKMIVNGAIIKMPFKPAGLNLKVSLNKFPLLQVNKALDNQLFGFAAVNGVVYLGGDVLKPLITGAVEISDNSALTFFLPQSNLNKKVEKELIRFVKKDSFLLSSEKYTAVENIKTDSVLHQQNATVNIHLKSASAINLIVDPSAGDELNLHGDASLNATLNAAGNVLLYGLYKLDSGFYRLGNQYLQKQFKLLPGSTITFIGQPGNALVSIKAVYAIYTDAYDLLKNEIGYLDKHSLQALERKLPFKVQLNLNGTIKNLKMRFNILLDTSGLQQNSKERMAIENKLMQLAENDIATNKQVFSLLLYNRFVGEQSNDFFSIPGAVNENNFDKPSYESVSGFLSAAIDNIAEDIFKTLDVYHNLNNYKDYGNGNAQQKRVINIESSKSFINDRLSLNVGKNYGIDGQDASAKAAQQKGIGFLPDVTLTYKFSRDGNIRYRSYKKNQFEVTVDGYVTETGVSLLLNMDYDKFSTLLGRHQHYNKIK